MQKFIDDEAGYIRWAETHPTGFVINAPRTGQTVEPVLHAATCKSITTDKHTHYTGPGYYKICSENKEELADWARNQGLTLQLHAQCKP